MKSSISHPSTANRKPQTTNWPFKVSILIKCFLIMMLLPAKIYSQGITLELIPSNYDDYNISYFGGQDGYIDLTVTGGVPPNTYSWSNGSELEDQWDLAAGYYHVQVIDSHNSKAD